MVLLLLGLVLVFGWIDWGGLAGWVRPRAPWLAAFAAATVFAAVGARAWWSTSAPHVPARAPRLSWRTVAAAAVVVGVVVWGATSWLLAEADRATTADGKAAAKVDAVKAGLGIGAGATGIFALLLAVRRQTHQERTAADTLHDATERRVTDLYTKAADQLGSPKAAVRLAGLYALERLGQDHEDHRDTIFELLCAYLRMRYTEPDAPDDEAGSETLDRYGDQLQEGQVRAAALRILIRHHARDDLLPRMYWAGVIDLTGAYLVGASLSYADLKQASMANARLRGASLGNADLFRADLSGADLVGAGLRAANLGHARLRDADLSHAFLSGTDLTGADLGNARLDGALVDEDTRINLPAEYEFHESESGGRPQIRRRDDP